MTRILHTGDTHLGYRQYHSTERRSDFIDAFSKVVADAIDLNVSAVVHAGDLFHTHQPELQDILSCIDILRTLQHAKIPFLGIVGNHERKPNSQWLDLFERMGLAERLGSDPVLIENVAVYGLDYLPRNQRESDAYSFSPHTGEYAVLVSHGRFLPLVQAYNEDGWDITTVLQESTIPFDVVLLGDEHDPKTQEVNDTWVTYCGSTERTSASERKDRGYNIVSIEDTVQITRRGIDTRPFVYVDVDLSKGEGMSRILDRIDEYEISDAVVYVTIVGDGDDVAPAEIERYANENGALITRVADHRSIDPNVEDTDIAFTDPNQAVDSELRTMQLSEAAQQLDHIIRGESVADSNVANEGEKLISSLLDDPDAFEPPDEVTTEPEPSTEMGPLPVPDSKESPDSASKDNKNERLLEDGSPSSMEDKTPDLQSDQSSMEDYV